MSDLISRLSEIRSNYNCMDENDEPYYRALSEAIQLASTQPKSEERTAESAQNVPNDELISKKSAIEVIDAVFPVDPMKSEYAQGIACGAAHVEQLPSAQPEQPPYVAEIESEYRKAVNNPYIKKPLAKALYEVWKKHDRDDAERRVTDGGLD